MEPRKKIIILVSIFGVISVTLIVLAFIFYKNQSNNADIFEPEQNISYDSASGETVVNPDGWVPETEGDISSVTILGLTELVNSGLNIDQIDLLRGHIDNFSKQNKVDNQTVEKVSFQISSKQISASSSTGVKSISINIIINDKTTLKAVLSYIVSKELDLEIYNTNNQLLFSS